MSKNWAFSGHSFNGIKYIKYILVCSCILSINEIWQYPLQPKLSKSLTDFNDKPGFSINVGSLGVKTIALFNYKTIIFGRIKHCKTLIYTVVNLICNLILNF